jgi:nicotinamidase-related amidase
MNLNPILCATLLGFAGSAQAGETPRTLFQMASAVPVAARLSDSVLIIIDAQREYVDGVLPLDGVEAAIAETAGLLKRARAAGTPVVHVVHRGGGAFFNPQGPGFQIVEPLRPLPGERVIEKQRVSAFAGTPLEEALRKLGRGKLIVVGFMTHNCVSTTVRDANDLGFAVTVLAPATATRALPDGRGGVVSASVIQE